jgi:hypothetical protein
LKDFANFALQRERELLTTFQAWPNTQMIATSCKQCTRERKTAYIRKCVGGVWGKPNSSNPTVHCAAARYSFWETKYAASDVAGGIHLTLVQGARHRWDGIPD